MITKQSTPEGDNPFYRFRLGQRAMARRFDQLAMIIHHLRTEPEKRITVVYPNKLACDQFIEFANANYVIFETGPVERFGRGMVKQDIISFDIRAKE